MTRQANRLDAMDVGEIDDIVFLYADDLATGETIASASVTCEYLEGDADPSPQSMITGAYQIGTIAGEDFTPDPAGPVVIQRITAQQANTAYDLRCIATLSTGRKITAAAILPVLKL